MGFGILMAGVVGLLVRGALLGSGVAALAVQAGAVALMIWARITFGFRSFHLAGNPTEGGLVTTGPYRYLRHPIYAAILYFVWAGAASHLSLWNGLLGAVVALGLSFRALSEEKLVSERYPEYAEYAKRTARVLPFIL